MTTAERVEELLAEMTVEEKVAQLGGAWFARLLDGGELADGALREHLGHGIGHITRIAAESGAGPDRTAAWANGIQRFLLDHTRLAIPAVIHEEAVAGLCGAGAAQFPQAIGLASTWDPDLVHDVAAAAGRHLRAVGARLALSPVLDVARDPRWGRLEETYGEDPWLVSRMAVAFVTGIQSQGIVATGKHFLAYGAPDGGFNHAPASVGPRLLRDVYAFPFRAAINEAGLGAVMNAYNEVDGVPCGGSREILTDLLRGELGFGGTVVADYFAVTLLYSYHHVAADDADAGAQALTAGIDVELPALQAYRDLPGRVDDDLIDAAVRRVLAEKFDLGLFDDPFVDEAAAPAAFDTAADRALARTAAARSVVLLTNDGTLPLRAGATVAVLGPSADDPRLLLGDYSWPAHVELMAGDTQVDGMPGTKAGFALVQVPTTTPRAGLAAAGFTLVDDPAAADVAVVCVGGRSGLTVESTSGEFRDVTDLGLPADQVELVRATAATGTPTVVVVVGGRAHALSDVVDHAAALVVAWLPGEEGGAGLADVLTGATNPAGRLPVSLLRSAGQVGVQGGHHRGAGRSMFLGEGDYVDAPAGPLFAFGHGLSYTTFEHDGLDVTAATTSGDVTVALAVTNTGDHDGDEVVQLYVRDEVASVGTPERRLVAFLRVPVAAGATVRLAATIPAARLGFHGRDLRYRVEPGTMTFMVGASRDDIRQEATVELGGELAFPDPNAIPAPTWQVR